MKFVANPVIVDAAVILESHRIETTDEPHYHLRLGEGLPFETFIAGPDMVSRMEPKAGDYLVRQADGYIYLNPKDVFERKYRPAQPILRQLSFSDALILAKQGYKIARAGWNGKAMWVAVSGPAGNNLAADKFWNKHSRAHAEAMGGSAVVDPYFIMKTAQDSIQMGWIASQADLLGVDWEVVD